VNKQINFYYPHSDYTRWPIDMRKQITQEISLESYYFVGFRVEEDFETRYQHALIIADDYESLISGLVRKIESIKRKFNKVPPHEIALVFFRNMKMSDPVFLKTLRENGIKAEVDAILAKRDDDRYTTVGMINEQTELYPMKATDGLAAIRVARLKFFKNFAEYFMPLEICQAHPVCKEFDVLFQIVAKRTLALINCEATCSNLVH